MGILYSEDTLLQDFLSSPCTSAHVMCKQKQDIRSTVGKLDVNFWLRMEELDEKTGNFVVK